MTRRDVRREMIQGTVDLLAAHGVAGTSFALVVAETDAPRGSIYHHFPGGKNELVGEAVTSVGASVTALIDGLDARSPAEVVTAFLDGWRALLTGSGFARGCAVAAVGLGADDVDAIRTAADAAFDSWRAALTQALVRSGLDASTASDIAALSLAAVEGALILGRVARSDEVFDVLHRQLVRLVDDTAAGAP